MRFLFCLYYLANTFFLNSAGCMRDINKDMALFDTVPEVIFIYKVLLYVLLNVYSISDRNILANIMYYVYLLYMWRHLTTGIR